MDKKLHSMPLSLRQVKITDDFWLREMELVRNHVIPYQWQALNDAVPDATPSWCMHNFRAAGRLMARKAAEGERWVAPKFGNPPFEVLPDDPANPEEDKFYGFLFQDSDFYKWVEAVGYSLTQHPDAELEQIADGAIDVLAAAQDVDGYLDTYYILNGRDQSFTNLRDNHELYCMGHLVEGAVSYYQATGKDKLLKVACRYVDYVDQCFGPEPEKLKGYPGHEVAELALVKLYEVTGEERYWKLAQFFLDERGTEPNYFVQEDMLRAQRAGRKFRPRSYEYYQAHKPVREQDEAVGHSVRAMYLYAGMADAARMSGDEGMLAACEKLWQSTARDKLYITGGVGGTRHGEAFSFPFDLPNDLAYSETCAAIGLVFFARRMLQLRPDSRYADVMEQALYNTVLAGMALDGQSFFYVNPLSVHPEAAHRNENFSHVKPVRQKWFGCACCPPNIARMVSSVGMYAWTQSEDILYTHLYVGGQAQYKGLTLEMTSGMPWQGQGKAVIHADAPVKTTLAFRLPGWSEGAAVHADKAMEIRDGYAYFTGEWREGDIVTFDFPMRVRMQMADQRVRENVGKVAFTRGPVTYCMEQADNGDQLQLMKVDAAKVGARCENVAEQEDGIGGHPMVTLTVPGLREKAAAQDTLYADYQAPALDAVQLKLIPYFAWANRGEGEMDVWLRV